MSSARPWKLPAPANISPVWQPQPPKNGSSLPQTTRTLESGYCGSSSVATAPPDTPPPLGPSHIGRFTALRMKIGEEQIAPLSCQIMNARVDGLLGAARKPHRSPPFLACDSSFPSHLPQRLARRAAGRYCVLQLRC